MKQTVKTFEVNVSMKYTHDYIIKAKTKAEANKKALEKVRRLPLKYFDFFTDKIDNL